jgi:hypothetical protein
MPESERISVEEHDASAAPSKNVVDMISTPSPTNISRSCKLGDLMGPERRERCPLELQLQPLKSSSKGLGHNKPSQYKPVFKANAEALVAFFMPSF